MQSEMAHPTDWIHTGNSQMGSAMKNVFKQRAGAQVPETGRGGSPWKKQVAPQL